MADYNLKGLSNRNFEHLIQALAIKLIGPDIVIFGDGPDGGREATFDGPILYPTESDNWSGYGVIQAKLKERPEGSKKDGDWALAELKGELKKFIDPERNLRQPEYYIFVTNVVLTPVHEKGSKDKVEQCFRDYQDRLPFKGYDVWDYDKLCRFIDNNHDVRTAYAAWITSGDVLAEMMAWMKFQIPGFKRIITTFLGKELLANCFANLQQAGHHPDGESIPLAKVFVDLPAKQSADSGVSMSQREASSTNIPAVVAHILEQAEEKLDPESINQRFENHQNQTNQILNKGRFVLIGGPGQGKTTLSQFISQLFQVALLKEENYPKHGELGKTIEVFEEQCQQEKIDLPIGRRFPICVTLRKFAVKLHKKETKSLLSYLSELILDRTDETITTADLRLWLENYPWLLILDGLDEVPASSNRSQVMQAIRDFWVDVQNCRADILVIATSRPQGYNEEFSPELYQHIELTPLTTQQALHYGKRLATVRYNNPERRKKVIRHLQQAVQTTSTMRLMGTPLQITIMTALVDQSGQPPQDRWRLFKEYYNVIYRREMGRDTLLATILRRYQTEIDTIHHQVGLFLQLEAEQSGQTDTTMSMDQFRELIATRLAEDEYDEGYDVVFIEQRIAEAATHRLVFLVAPKEGQVGFEIRSLQEFMAAEALMDGPDLMIEEHLTKIAPLAQWRNVFLFAAGKCFIERRHLRNTICVICETLNEGEGTADELNASIDQVILPGSQLALDLLEDQSLQPKYRKFLARVALQLLDVPSIRYHHQLVDSCYYSDMEKIYQDEIEKRLTQSKLHLQFGAWQLLLNLADKRETDWAEDMVYRYWFECEENEQAEILRTISLNFDDWGWLSQEFDLLEKLSLFLSPDEVRREISHNSFDPDQLYDMAVFRDEGLVRTTDISLNLLPAEKVSDFHVEIFTVDENKDDLLILLKDMDDNRPEWTTLIAGARFLENPSSQTLVEALHTIAQKAAYPFSYTTIELLPWPLQALLLSVSALDELDALAVRVEEGEFGDIEDWATAEKRWRTQGITKDDIYHTDSHWPYNKTIAQQGFPFIIIEADHRNIRVLNLQVEAMVKRGHNLFDTLLTLYPKLNGPMSSMVARLVLYVARHVEFDRFLKVDQMEEILKKAHSTYEFGLFFISDIVKTFPLTDQYIELVDYIGRRAVLYVYSMRSFDTKIVEILVDKFCEDPTKVGLLRAIAIVTTNMAYRANIPEPLLRPEQYDDPKFREAAVLVLLANNKWSVTPQDLANQVIDLWKTRPSILRRIRDTIHHNNLSGTKLNRFLLTLYNQLPVDAIDTRRSMFLDLDRTREQRSSGLVVEEVL